MLRAGSWQGIETFTVAYLREDVHASIQSASNIFSGLVIGIIVGNYLGGFLVKRIGLKRLVTVTPLLCGVFIIGYMNASSLTSAVLFCGIMSLVSGVAMTCIVTLTLDQVPDYKGTVISLNTAAVRLGIVIAIAFGGLVLNNHVWNMVGLTYGCMSILGALIFNYGIIENINKQNKTMQISTLYLFFIKIKQEISPNRKTMDDNIVMNGASGGI